MKCPNCKSMQLVKSGEVWSGRKKRQRYLCRSCGMNTVKPKR
jgi:transposase-like protein